VPSDPILQPVLLTTAPTEFAAQTIVHALKEEGIQAWSMGGMPMEAASQVKIMVLQADLELARAALDVIRREAQAIDWNAMDDATLGTLSPEDETMLKRSRARVPVSGVVVTGLGAVALTGHRTMFQSLPAPTRPVPGSIMIVAGLIWCYAARRGRNV